MSENILYKFAKDLSRLYAKIQVKDVENCFIKVAQFMESEIEDWLSKAIQQNYKSSLQNPKVLDTLVLLARLKKTYSGGMSNSEFVKVFINDTKLTSYVPMIVSFREAANSNDFAILAPYKGFLDAPQNIPDRYPSDTAIITHDLSSLDNMFRQEMAHKVNQPYEEFTETNKKIGKKEKIGGLLQYLSRRFSAEISTAFESIGQIDVVGIADNPIAIRDPISIIKKMFPDYPPENIPMLVKEANAIVKEILKVSDPQYYDYVFNYVKNRIMQNAAVISKQQFNQFTYESRLKLQEQDVGQMDTLDVPPTSWTFSYVLILLSMVLYILATKSQ